MLFGTLECGTLWGCASSALRKGDVKGGGFAQIEATLQCCGALTLIPAAFGLPQQNTKRIAPQRHTSTAKMGAGASVDEGVTVDGELAKVLNAKVWDVATGECVATLKAACPQTRGPA